MLKIKALITNSETIPGWGNAMINYSKSAKSSSSGVSWLYKSTASYSFPCRPDDNNRLESSSKGSSCPLLHTNL